MFSDPNGRSHQCLEARRTLQTLVGEIAADLHKAEGHRLHETILHSINGAMPDTLFDMVSQLFLLGSRAGEGVFASPERVP